MSAFLLSDRHLSAIVRAWTNATVYRIQPRIGDRTLDPTNFEDWQRFMDAIHAANVASVNYRYSGSPAVDVPAPRYLDSRAPKVEGLALVKALDCFDYQSCEVPGYESTPIAKAIEELRMQTIRRLPGYDEAAWAI